MRTGHTILILRPLFIIVFGCTMADSVFAARWWNGNASFTPYVSAIATDNVCLTKNNKKSDLGVGGGAALTPSGSVSRNTGKTTFNASGSLRYNALNTTSGGGCNDGDSNTIFGEDNPDWIPAIRTTFSTILIDDLLKVSAYGVADQNAVSYSRPFSADGVNQNGNTNTYYRYSVSPFLSHPVNDIDARYSVRYTFSDQINTANSVSNSNSHRVATGLTSASSSPLSWGLLGNYTKVVYNDDVIDFDTGEVIPRQDTELQNVRLRLGYQIDRTWEINGTTGWEFNDFQTTNSSSKSGGAWDLGLRWTPSSRTSVSVGSGDRFFGQTPRVTFRHRRKQSLFSGSYNRRLTFRNEITTRGIDPINGLDGQLIDSAFQNSSLSSNGPIIDNRGTLGYSYTGSKATISAYGSYSQQTREEDGAEAEYKRYSVTISPRIAGRYNVSASLGWFEDEPLGTTGASSNQIGETASNWTYSVRVGRPIPISNRMSANINFQHIDQQSGDSFNEYQENRVTATLNIRLF